MKLGDFGLSKLLAPEQHLANTYVGTPYYMSPEIVSELSYTHKSDIWSLGCIIYELCQLTPPFNAKTQWALAKKIKDGQYPSISSHYSPMLKKAIDMCLQVDHRKRPDTAGLLQMEPFMLARKQLNVVHLLRDLKSREEAIKNREHQLLALEEEMKANWEERNTHLYQQIDAELRQKWEVKAVLEIRKRVEIEFQNRLHAEVAALLDIEVQRRIQQLGLVPAMRHSASSDSTDSSGMQNGTLMDEPLSQIAPDSPADVTMRSPSIMGTPARRRFSTNPIEEPPRMDITSLDQADILDESPCPTPIENQNPFAIDDTASAPVIETQRTSYIKGSPSRAAPRGATGLQRAGTTGTLLFPPAGGNKNGFGLGGRGESLDDVATVGRSGAKTVPIGKEARGYGTPKSAGMAQAISLVEISRQKEERAAKAISQDPVARWDPEDHDAPSPFIKRVLL